MSSHDPRLLIGLGSGGEIRPSVDPVAVGRDQPVRAAGDQPDARDSRAGGPPASIELRSRQVRAWLLPIGRKR